MFFAGASSFSFYGSTRICYVDWERAVLYLYGAAFRDNNARDQLEMVTLIAVIRRTFFDSKFSLLYPRLIWTLLWWRYLDVVGKKKSKPYVVNGVAIFLTWLVSVTIWNSYYVLLPVLAHLCRNLSFWANGSNQDMWFIEVSLSRLSSDISLLCLSLTSLLGSRLEYNVYVVTKDRFLCVILF